jgi:hypothetical protein
MLVRIKYFINLAEHRLVAWSHQLGVSNKIVFSERQTIRDRFSR